MNIFLLFYFLCHVSLITCQPFFSLGRDDHLIKKRLFSLNNSDPLRRLRIGVQRMRAGMRDFVSRMVGGRGHYRPVYIQYPARPQSNQYSPYPPEVADFNAYHTGNIEAAQESLLPHHSPPVPVSHHIENNYPNALHVIQAEDMKHEPVAQYDTPDDTYADPIVENSLGFQSLEDNYSNHQPSEFFDSPSSESYTGLSHTEESHESESYGSPQAEVLTYPGEYEYIPEQSLNSFEAFASFDTDVASDPGPEHDNQNDNYIQDTGPGPGADLQTPDDFDVVNLPQVLDDDEPNIPQVPSSDTPDQTNPQQYINNEPGAVNSVLNNPLDYSEAVTNFMEKMRAERILVLDLTRRV